MKTLAAILVEPKKPLVLEDLEIPSLAPGQVLVEIRYSGVCQTQLLEVRGHRGRDPYLPHCLGHEGSGVVLETGPGVTKVRAGDRVVLSWIKGSGADVKGPMYRWGSREVNAGPITTFSRISVIAENRASPLLEGVEFPDAALLGCAVPTGVGAVVNSLGARAGQSIAVFGAGGVGLCAVAGARVSGLTPIVAVDVQAGKEGVAREMGATHFVDASRSDAVEEVRRICPGGVDLAVEASGRPAVMAQALSAVRDRGGDAVVIGNARFGERIEIDPRQLNHGKRLLGTWGGDSVPDRDYPRYAKLLRDGRIRLGPLLTNTYPLREINRALDDLESGLLGRPLVDMTAG